MTLVGLFGAGGFARETMPVLRANHAGAEAVFIDDRAGAAELNGHRLMTWDAFVAEPAEEKRVCIAIGESAVRERLADRCAAAGVGFASSRADNALVLDDVEIGEGAVLSPFSMITSNVRIGRHFHANIYSYVAHDCRIGDFVTLAPDVHCNGNVHVEDHAYLGTGAVIRQGRPGAPLVIGRGAVVGMGAVVTRSVPPGVTVVGNPARPMEKRD